MKHLLFGVFLMLSCMGTLLAGGAKIEFEKQDHDFGQLKQGTTVQYSFRFKNTGDEPLKIESVKSSCGCTAALASDSLIQPGEESFIDVSYDSRGKRGKVNKTVRVRSNDSDRSIAYLYIKGFVSQSDHPQITGTQNLFQGTCKKCHMDRGVGKMGGALYEASCAICHENHRKPGGHFIASSSDRLSRMSSRRLYKVVSKGLPNKSMPAFHDSKGGPLSRDQIKSLVKFLHSLRNKKKK